MSAENAAKPTINVTPLIDVLLVLLIIFMVASPMKPNSFKTKIPAEPDKNADVNPNPESLVITINSNLSLKLNKAADFGTTAEPQKLVDELKRIFEERQKNRVFADGMETRGDLPDAERTLKTVFIKAPRKIPYGEVTKIVDAVKLSGAYPIGLQTDDLE